MPAESIQPQALLSRVLERGNMQRVLKQVRRNKGAPGIDGMTVDDLPEYLRNHWPAVRAQLLSGSYRPRPGAARGDPEAGWEDSLLGDSHGVGPPHLPSHCAGDQCAMGTFTFTATATHFFFCPRRSAHQAIRLGQARF